MNLDNRKYVYIVENGSKESFKIPNEDIQGIFNLTNLKKLNTESGAQ